MTTNQIIIRTTNGAGEYLGSSRAKTVEEAASRYARRVGRKVFAQRETGTAGKSGVFVLYRDVTRSGEVFSASRVSQIWIG